MSEPERYFVDHQETKWVEKQYIEYCFSGREYLWTKWIKHISLGN
jgi:hypothetical protein